MHRMNFIVGRWWLAALMVAVWTGAVLTTVAGDLGPEWLNTVLPEPGDRDSRRFTILQTKQDVILVPNQKPAQTKVVPLLELNERDELRVDETGGAVILGKKSAAAIGAFSRLEARRFPSLRLFQGKVWVRDFGVDTNRLEITTTHGDTVPLGTEYQVTQSSNQTEVVLLRGMLKLANDAGTTNITEPGDTFIMETGRAPYRAARITAINDVIEWILYYPAILRLEDLGESASELVREPALAETVGAYRRGNLPRAIGSYPWARSAISPAERAFRAMLLLSADRIPEATNLLETLGSPEQEKDKWEIEGRVAEALRELVAAVKFREWKPVRVPTTATEWMARSYYEQSRSRLGAAREAARRAVELAPEFGYGRARLAELEFGFADRKSVEEQVTLARQHSPDNAQVRTLEGFLNAAKGNSLDARESFTNAIHMDGRLGNGWLGLGLIEFGRGNETNGLQYLEMAVAVEPQRALLRSYLGKGYHTIGQLEMALNELEHARAMDTNDPTPRLYAALVKYDQNRFNDAIRDLEESKRLNDNRQLYRSNLRLDEDMGVRSANLAAIYRDAGMIDRSVHEAARAVNSDYANYSSHLFLANSYDALRDPKQVNLRYETPWLNELLLANLFQPAGVDGLSQNISQQEYTRMFEPDHVGLYSQTDYASAGDWRQAASVHGQFDKLGFSVDTLYRSLAGDRPNNDLEDWTTYAKVKVSPWEGHSFLLQTIWYGLDSGDTRQFHDREQASQTLRVHEEQRPLALLGYHREWSADHQTLFLFSGLNDDLEVDDARTGSEVVFRGGDGTIDPTFDPAGFQNQLQYQSDLEIYSGEVQHLWRQEFDRSDTTLQTLVGVRGQFGEFDTSASLRFRTSLTNFPPILLSDPILRQSSESDFSRFSAYAYETLEWNRNVWLTLGISYDALKYPVNHRSAPISDEEDTTDQVSPKAGIIWMPTPATTLRGAYTRSLGGVSFDQSFRLEPTQVGGFIQSYRSLIPEAITASLVAPTFETRSLAFEQRLGTNWYASVVGEWLLSDARMTQGVFDAQMYRPIAPSSRAAELEFEEMSLQASLNYLLGANWSLGARYRLARANLEVEWGDATGRDEEQSSLLHELGLGVRYQASCGLFSAIEAVWRRQENRGQEPAMEGDDFWQLNLQAGYRFALGPGRGLGVRLPATRGEIRLGILNLTDQDFQLHPLNFYYEQPRERTFVASLRLEF